MASQSASSYVSGDSYSKGSVGSQSGAPTSYMDQTENLADSQIQASQAVNEQTDMDGSEKHSYASGPGSQGSASTTSRATVNQRKTHEAGFADGKEDSVSQHLENL